MKYEPKMSTAQSNRDHLANAKGNPAEKGNLELGYQRILVSDWLEKAGMLHEVPLQSKANEL